MPSSMMINIHGLSTEKSARLWCFNTGSHDCRHQPPLSQNLKTTHQSILTLIPPIPKQTILKIFTHNKHVQHVYKLFLLLIPVLIGAVSGTFLAFYLEAQPDSSILTATKLTTGGSPLLGDTDAPITILEWGDYQCTFCYKFHQDTLHIIQQDYIETGKVNLIFKDYPLNGPDSLLAAEASYCAKDQEKYWQYHDELYENWGGERTGWITRDSLDQFAANVGLNLAVFNECLDKQIHQETVISVHESGKKLGIDATPSFLVFNDEKIIKIRGNQPLEVFQRAFEELT